MSEKRVYEKDSSSGSPPQSPIMVDPTLVDPRESLHRDLKARQISMIALGGAVGTGYVIVVSVKVWRN
jgi:yeast amino acid transporter